MTPKQEQVGLLISLSCGHNRHPDSIEAARFHEHLGFAGFLDPIQNYESVHKEESVNQSYRPFEGRRDTPKAKTRNLSYDIKDEETKVDHYSKQQNNKLKDSEISLVDPDFNSEYQQSASSMMLNIADIKVLDESAAIRGSGLRFDLVMSDHEQNESDCNAQLSVGDIDIDIQPKTIINGSKSPVSASHRRMR